jgi:hypothetical protein
MSKFITQTRKTGALGATMAASATSATLAAATFGSPVGKQILTIDEGNANAADFLCTIVGTAVSSMVLLNGSDVEHAKDAVVTMNAVDEHYNLIYNALDDGWVDPLETPTKGTGNTLVFSGIDRTSTYAVGDKIKLTDTTVKYFYVTASAFSTNTTLTVVGDTLVGNPTAGSFYFSKSTSPVGFPQWFTFVPSWTNVSGGTDTYAKFNIIGKTCTLKCKYTLGGAGVGAGVSMTLPVSAATTDIVMPMGTVIMKDDGASTYHGTVQTVSTNTIGIYAQVSSDTYLTAVDLSSTIPITWATGDYIAFIGTYDIA